MLLGAGIAVRRVRHVVDTRRQLEISGHPTADERDVRQKDTIHTVTRECSPRTYVLELDARRAGALEEGHHEIELHQVARGVREAHAGHLIQGTLKRVTDPTFQTARPLRFCLEFHPTRIDLVDVVVDEQSIGRIRLLCDEIVDVVMEARSGDRN